MAEKEYIEIQNLKDDISSLNVTVGGKSIFNDDAKSSVLSIIDLQPTADVQEVRHGRNITEANPVDEFMCSKCGFACEIFENIYDYEGYLDCQRECNPDFCPRCGAKMDEE